MNSVFVSKTGEVVRCALNTFRLIGSWPWLRRLRIAMIARKVGTVTAFGRRSELLAHIRWSRCRRPFLSEASKIWVDNGEGLFGSGLETSLLPSQHIR